MTSGVIQDKSGDFRIDRQQVIEVGGPDKGLSQVKG
jgi:hypothetical protein